MKKFPIGKMTKKERRAYDAALAATKNSFAPYSNFPVGAAIMDETGEIHPGCNVEISSFGLTMCAERSAIFGMVSRVGKRKIDLVCCVLRGGADDGGSCCGACRQVIWDFCFGDKKVPVILADYDGNFRRTTSGRMLPDGFVLT